MYKALILVLWLALIIVGSITSEFISMESHYLYGFMIGAFSTALYIASKHLD